MRSATHRRAGGAAALVAGALAASAATLAFAADATAERRLRVEWVGVELSPLSVTTGHAPARDVGLAVHAGLGGTLRAFRLRWTNAYWTPLEAGLFVGSRDQVGNVILAHVQTEGGVRLPLGGGQAVELGLAAGAGILAIPYSVDCDGTCVVGGVGIVVSPVARYLFNAGGRCSPRAKKYSGISRGGA
jgi:hypothetical protein